MNPQSVDPKSPPVPHATADGQPMEDTGERLVPETSAERNFWEHIYRYRFASQYVKGKQVVDVACGEGYGTSSMLKAGAKSVVGFDLDGEAAAHARARYGVDARQADACKLPLDNESVDVVVSFETLEHLSDQDRFMAECRRVLVPGGTIIVSTPNVETYTEYYQNRNVYHEKELTRSQFIDLAGRHFGGESRLYSQFFTRGRPRGIGRVLLPISRMVCPTTKPNSSASYRPRADDAILDRSHVGVGLMNPYSVLRWHPFLTAPLYFVLVASKPGAFRQ